MPSQRTSLRRGSLIGTYRCLIVISWRARNETAGDRKLRVSLWSGPKVSTQKMLASMRPCCCRMIAKAF